MKFLKASFLIVTQFLLLNCTGLIPTYGGYPLPSTSPEAAEKKEFADLMAKDQVNKDQRTAEVLTYLLNDDDPEDPKTALVVENTSSCDIILRVVSVDGKRIYNLPIPRNAKNHFIVYKGNYTLKSNVCTAKYYSQKSIFDSMVLTIRVN